MTTARDLLTNRVQPQLNDKRGEHWGLIELLAYLNDGLQEMVKYVPSDFAKIQTVTLAAGAKQTLPGQGIGLVRVVANVNGDDSLGNVPFQTTRQALDVGDPTWRTTAQGTTEEWAYDPRDPLVYWVNPPAASGNKLEIEFVERPTVLSINANLPISLRYEPALIDYIKYRAHSKDTDYAETGLIGQYYNAFLQGVGATSGESQ